jgi:hypothetical protein
VEGSEFNSFAGRNDVAACAGGLLFGQLAQDEA